MRTPIGALLLATSVSAHAAPIQEIEPWAKDFTQAALANDPAAMFAKVSAIAHPGFNMDALHGVFQKLDGVVGTGKGSFAEQFGERNVGSFLKLINIAVRYPSTYMYYSIIFSHDASGWQMTQFNYNTNVNEALSVKWPE